MYLNINESAITETFIYPFNIIAEQCSEDYFESLLEGEEDDSLLEAFAEADMLTLLESFRRRPSSNVAGGRGGIRPRRYVRFGRGQLISRPSGDIKSKFSGFLRAGKDKFSKLGGTGKIAAGLAAAGGLGLATKKLLGGEGNKGKQPDTRSMLAKKISALRGLYAKWLERSEKEVDSGRASLFKRVAVKIMQLIDRLARKLESIA